MSPSAPRSVFSSSGSAPTASCPWWPSDGAYVSVGFPLPSANFTATLLPTNNRNDGLLLQSRTDLAYPGHYLSAVDAERDELSVIKLNTFDEEIDVYVVDGELKTDHRFYLSGILFLTLFYSIERKA